jgi:hypothetical protein
MTATEELRLEARLAVFGSETGPARVRVVPRDDRWRLIAAARWFLAGLVVAPLVVLVPPHVPWALGALVGGGLMGLRRWKERITLKALEGPCPRCGMALTLDRPTPLRDPHMVSCPGCRHEVRLTVETVPRV